MTPALERLAGLAQSGGQPFIALQRLHVLEGVLRRVSRRPDRDTLVLRGSLMTRLWARPSHRVANDVDFVTTFDFDPHRAVELLRAALTPPDCDDGVSFSPELLRSETTWSETPFPGVRVTVPSWVGEFHHEVQIDLGFADPLVPAAVWLDYPSLSPEWNARVLSCRPELGCAWKIHGLFEKGPWRKKDLHDVGLILRHTPLEVGMLQDAVRVAFESRQTPLHTIRRLLEGNFGASPSSQRTWRRFRREQADPTIPENLSVVVQSVADQLRPILEPLLG